MRLATCVTLLLVTTVPPAIDTVTEERAEIRENVFEIVSVRSGQITIDAEEDGHVVVFGYQPADGIQLSYPYRQNQRTDIKQGRNNLHGLVSLPTSSHGESVYLIAVRTDNAPRLSDLRAEIGPRPSAPGPKVRTARSPEAMARQLARLTGAEADQPEVSICSIPPNWDFTKWPEYSC